MLTLLMFLAFLEILARRVGAPEETKNIEMDFNADLMWQLRDDPRKGPEYRVNALGLRGPELESGDTLRVMSTGDSSIYGHSVRISQVFTSVLADRLESMRPGAPVEGVIGGIPGYSSFQSLRLLERVGETVRPDVLIIGNMWSDAYQSAISDEDWAAQLQAAYGPWLPITRPLARLSEHAALARHVRTQVHARFYPAKEKATEIGWMHLTKAEPGLEDPTETTESLLLREQEEARARALGKAVDKPVGGNAPLPGPDGGTGLDSGAASRGEVKPPPGRETTRVPLDPYERNLRALVARARALGALPVLLMLPHPADEVEVTVLEEGYRAAMQRVATSERVPLADARRWFLAHPRDEDRFADDIHPNALGHADVATALLEVLAATPAYAERLRIPPGALSTLDAAAPPGPPTPGSAPRPLGAPD